MNCKEEFGCSEFKAGSSTNSSIGRLEACCSKHMLLLLLVDAYDRSAFVRSDRKTKMDETTMAEFEKTASSWIRANSHVYADEIGRDDDEYNECELCCDHEIPAVNAKNSLVCKLDKNYYCIGTADCLLLHLLTHDLWPEIVKLAKRTDTFVDKLTLANVKQAFI